MRRMQHGQKKREEKRCHSIEEFSNPTTNGGVQNGKVSWNAHAMLCTLFFTRLAPICMLSRSLPTKSLHRSSGGSLLRARCWLGSGEMERGRRRRKKMQETEMRRKKKKLVIPPEQKRSRRKRSRIYLPFFFVTVSIADFADRFALLVCRCRCRFQPQLMIQRSPLPDSF